MKKALEALAFFGLMVKGEENCRKPFLSSAGWVLNY